MIADLEVSDLLVRCCDTRRRRLLGCLLAAMILPLVTSGCICSAVHAVPASRLSPELLPKSRSARVPIDYTLLRQQPPDTYIIGVKDIVGVYIQDVVPTTVNRQEPNILNLPVLTQADYYPPRGMVNSPAVGLPMEVNAEGTVILPLVPPIKLAGLTLTQAVENIRQEYSVKRRILEQGRERIMVTLIRPRVQRVVVLRDDIPFQPTFQPQGNAALLTRRGTANVIDLPAFENDVLHALSITGGLPGVDAFSTIWVFRARVAGLEAMDAVKRRVDAGEPLETVVKDIKVDRTAVRIPLRACPDEPLPFSPSDVVLETGDVVYIETRQAEYFYSGGLLPPGQVPLPRDYDLDVIGALALATGSVGGPAGGPASSAFNFKGAYSPGNIIPPTRVLILRKLATGEQIQIRVDLKRAKVDQRERIIIAPGDVVMLYFKPAEVAGNWAANFASFNAAGIVAASK
jgi:protein involved in polysaccharide export with SLBB domain